MPGSRKGWRRGLRWALGLVGLIVLTTGAVGAWSIVHRRRPAYEGLPLSIVRRADLYVTLAAGGQVESERKTTIECKLESLHGAGPAGGASTIIELIDDGTEVKKGDVLCRLDASQFEELVRQQEIVVQQARADHLKATLTLKAAEMGLDEYRRGTLVQSVDQLRGQIVLSEAEVQRQTDRIAWAEKMLQKQYISVGELGSEHLALMQREIALGNLLTQMANLQRFEAPIAEKTLMAQVDSAQSQLSYQELRLRSTEDLLRQYRQQVENCTVRAPHDGIAILANDPRKDPKVLLGATVRQRMKLFYLPDLSTLEVLAVLNESVVNRVRPGASARVRLEAFADRELEGHVVSVASLPLEDRNRRSGGDIKSYVSHIRLHSAPPKLRPGMTAEVEIDTARRPHALVVPNESIAIEQGREVCYVAHEEALERRPVALGEVNRNLVEVTEGLEEGEEIVRDPSQIEPSEVAIIDDRDVEPTPTAIH